MVFCSNSLKKGWERFVVSSTLKVEEETRPLVML